MAEVRTEPRDTALSVVHRKSVDQRLRLHATLTRRPIGDVLDEALDRSLPTSDELAARITSGGVVTDAVAV